MQIKGIEVPDHFIHDATIGAMTIYGMSYQQAHNEAVHLMEQAIDRHGAEFIRQRLSEEPYADDNQ